MSVCQGVVVSLYEQPLVFHFPCYHPSSVFVPGSLDFLQLMSVDPWFDHLLVLAVDWICGFHFFLGQNSSHWRGFFGSSGPGKDVIG